MNIPIVILNRNRLSTLESMVDKLTLLGYTNLQVLDMSSTYEPLLEYYRTSANIYVTVVPNDGHTALWDKGYINQYKNHEYIVVTDSDIVLNENTPGGFIEQMICIAKDYRVDKVGLSIQIDNLPDNPMCNTIKPIEQRYWRQRLAHPTHTIYSAIVDTTFGIVNPKLPYGWHYPAVRMATPEYICQHYPWYLDYNNLNPEDQYIHDHNDIRFSSYKQLLQR